HTVSEVTDPGYSSVISGDCASNGSVTLAAGDTKACIITNTAIAPTLKLVKTVSLSHGGSATVSSFYGKIDGTNVAWNTATPVSPGSHTASETTLPGYTSVGWGGDCAANGSVSLALGDNKTCTITNSDMPASLMVCKTVVNANGGDTGKFNLFVDS